MNEKEECEERYPLVDALIDMLDGKTTTEETAERMFKAYMGDNNVGGQRRKEKDGGKDMNIELKPCPFCGGEAALVSSSIDCSCQVRCTKCGAETREVEDTGYYFTAYYATTIKAAELWNKRAGDNK